MNQLRYTIEKKIKLNLNNISIIYTYISIISFKTIKNAQKGTGKKLFSFYNFLSHFCEFVMKQSLNSHHQHHPNIYNFHHYLNI